MTSTRNPLKRFTEELVDFASGERRGIRNPFVMVPVEPSVEHRVTERLVQWADPETPDTLTNWAGIENQAGNELTVECVRLDHLMPETRVFETTLDLGPLERTTTNAVTETLETSLADELIEKLVEGQLKGENAQQHILLLVNLGSLYPFTRASELLDEMDRRNVNTTIGIPFPGSIRGGKLSFFNEDARHYYPTHRIDEKITEVYLDD
ncbi:BREX protein BrxB domain-containing protein [Salinirubrum litoreum]|uniref:BREX protein BrxB domain-containing protein n=1 Tax=Salinirubrum litoreum TaxID=1126234 RepID=A0ABD5REZ1_9EURY|nr:BREX protein BrxB domain-containing protein [Salinirubrum litoreum]